jgi:SAM-dependent methyltransferase
MPDDGDTGQVEAIAGFYARHALAFDRERGRHLMERRYLDAATRGLSTGADVLDLGCGGGEPMAAYCIEKGFNVTGIDIAEPMIALCRQRFPGHTWQTADMRGLDLGRRFAAILAWDSFFHLSPDDQRSMFAAFARHAAPGCSLLFTSGPDDGEIIGNLYGDPLFHASLAAGEFRALLDGAGFDIENHVVEDPACGHHTVWLARRRDIG